MCQGTKYRSVFKYCIQGCQERYCVESKGRGQETKGCLGDSQEGGNSGENQSDLDALFLPLSLSISMKRTVIACSDGCEALVHTGTSHIEGPGRLVNNIHRLIRTRPFGSKVKGHAQGSLPVPTHNKDLQGQPLSLSL